MAYNNYLIKVLSGVQGDYIISAKEIIKAESYTVTQSGQDVDSYRDADGSLHRNAIPHPCVKVEFEVKPMLTNVEVGQLMANIRSRMINRTEKKVSLSVYVPELDEYVVGEFYMPDVPITIYGSYDNKLTYNAFRMAFIQY